MDEIGKMISNYGFMGVLLIIILFIGLKYLPKIIELWLKRANEKNLVVDSVKSVIDNNTRALENNNIIINKFMQNEDVNGIKIDNLSEKIDNHCRDFKVHDKRAEEIAQDVKIIKHKKGE